jgi:hypothetical protein
MTTKDAAAFWTRYKRLAGKDLPILVKTDILQPTLSSWRTKKIFPRANETAAIAATLNTAVEFLVNGKDTGNATISPAAMNIALTADTLSGEGQKILAAVAESLAFKYPLTRRRVIKKGEVSPTLQPCSASSWSFAKGKTPKRLAEGLRPGASLTLPPLLGGSAP